MSLDAVLTILGMALATYAIRVSGFLLADRLPSSGFVAVWLKHIPGAVLASLVAPAVVSGGPAEWFASAVAVGAYAMSRNLFATMLAGVAAVLLARRFLESLAYFLPG